MEIVLESINFRKSIGWDGVFFKVFKLGVRELLGFLIVLYNLCLILGEWFVVWKKGEWILVFKKEDFYEKKNYRFIIV